MSCIQGKGGLKVIHCNTQNTALFVDLLVNIFLLVRTGEGQSVRVEEKGVKRMRELEKGNERER